MNFNAQLRDVYLIKAEMADGSFQYKIGISKHVEKRLLENKTSNPNNLQIVHVFKSLHSNIMETALKNRFRYCRIEGEWFNLSQQDVADFLITCDKMEKNFTVLKTSTLFNR
jgi:hypothetical protein